MNKYTGTTLLMVLFSFSVHAQYFLTGEDPACLKWRQIVTPDFQLIYPADFETKAQVIARYFEKVYEYGSATLQGRPNKISVIFHTRTIRSNGLVGYAPKRMEIFTPPHQDIYAQDWLEQLVLHEFRHVVQVDKINRELPLIVKLLLGEQGTALITGLYLPFWFIEGDAVISETTLSNTGRGRLPSFLSEHKAQVTEKGVFSFDKAYNGSFKDFVPDHYKLGYILTGESRARYGYALWNNVLERLAGKPFSFNPVNKSLRLQTGLNQEKLYLTIFDSLRSAWMEENRRFVPGPFDVVSSPPKVYADYRYNHILETGEIVSLKSDYDKTARFVVIDSTGKETTLCVPGEIFEESAGYRNNLIVWSENVPDIRWEHSGKSYIRVFDIVNKRMNSFIPEFKCFAPAISPDEHNVSVVETDFQNNYYLSVYSLQNRNLVKRYQTPGNYYLFSPVWKDSVTLIAVALTGEGKRLVLINPFAGKIEWLTKHDLGEIKQLTLNRGTLYFISSFSSKNELYSYEFDTGKISRVVRARFGVEYPAFSCDGERLVLSDYTSHGFRLIQPMHNRQDREPADQITKGNYQLAESLTSQEPGRVSFTDTTSFRYHSRSYSKLAHLFNFHSWGPFSFDMDSRELKPGISFASQNKLGTSVTSIGYKWNMSERAGFYYLKYEYTGLFPEITVEVQSGKRSAYYKQVTVLKNQAGNIVRRDTVEKRAFWNQKSFNLDTRIPLNYTKGNYFRLIQPEVKFDYTKYEHRHSTPEKFISGTIQSLASRIYYHQIARKSYRDILPEWGWMADVSYRFSPWGDHNLGNMLGAQLKCYWPGMGVNHGIVTYFGLQKRKQGEYNYSNIIDVPYGWPPLNSNVMFTSSAGYHMPLIYPDWNLGRFVYIRRLRTVLFYDFGWMKGHTYQENKIAGSFTKNMSTVGIDLIADSNFLRLYAPAYVGIRAAWLAGKQKLVAEFLFSVDFTSF